VVTIGRVRPGITVLLEDSLALVAGKRVGLLTNQSGIDEHGTSDIDLLYQAGEEDRDGDGPRLTLLFSPEHGIRGTEDRTNIANSRDARTGVPIISLYGATTLAPPDSALRAIDVLVIDLQDLGTRTWTYVASMVYAMRAAATQHLPVLVLDRPNPITGSHIEGPLLDTALAYAGSNSASRPANPVALYPIPLRHGLTMGELARFYNDVLDLHADLHVIPASGWHRDMWFDQTGLPWVRPSPNMPSLTSALLYPGIVMFEATNLSVGRGTPIAFQHVGAPWLDANRAVALLNARDLDGVRFEIEHFTPRSPTDRKYGGVSIPGIRVVVTDRDRVRAVRVGTAILWAVARTNADSLRVRAHAFDERLGAPGAREALLAGEDPDAVLDRFEPATVAFARAARQYYLYRDSGAPGPPKFPE
jgi:uncharacterized protein YbbC (DUF1343 family)